MKTVRSILRPGIRFALGILPVLLVQSQMDAQTPGKTWIFLRDKGAALTRHLSANDAASLGITQRSLWRRSKVLPPDQLIDTKDLKVDEAYLAGIRASGARIRAVSRWLNAVSVDATQEQLHRILQLPSVRSVDDVAVLRRRPLDLNPVPVQPTLSKNSAATALNYGPSFTQLSNIKVVDLHNLRVNGRGVIVGMVDDGYTNHSVHEATKNNTVIAEYDFIKGDSITSYQPGDDAGQGSHGMYTYSALSGFQPGFLIGPAYGASFLLAKTEVAATETRIEEDYYVQGLEWLEQQGADLVSSSLAYFVFDDSTGYNYSDQDGSTAVTTIAAKIATRKGVLIVTAMDNRGWYRVYSPEQLTGTLSTPADADSILSVGAVTSTGFLAGFSSTGPTYDGRIKPEVVAQGVSVVSASPATTNEYVSVSGTSLSTPLTAGVAALVLSAHPELTPMQIREAIINTAVPFNDGTSKTTYYPNNFYGYGMVNALEAALYHGMVFSNVPHVYEVGTELEVRMSIASKSTVVPDSVFLHYRPFTGAPFVKLLMSPTGVANEFKAVIPNMTDSASPRGYISAYTVAEGTRTSPAAAPATLYSFKSLITTVPPETPPTEFVLYDNYPNPFNAGTQITFDAPMGEWVELNIYNMLGQKIRRLFAGVSDGASRIFTWDGKDDHSRKTPSGVYLYRLETSRGMFTKKLMLLK